MLFLTKYYYISVKYLLLLKIAFFLWCVFIVPGVGRAEPVIVNVVGAFPAAPVCKTGQASVDYYHVLVDSLQEFMAAKLLGEAYEVQHGKPSKPPEPSLYGCVLAANGSVVDFVGEKYGYFLVRVHQDNNVIFTGYSMPFNKQKSDIAFEDININQYHLTFKFGRPATLSGIIKTSTFANCCINGKETISKYRFLDLNPPVDFLNGIDGDKVGTKDVQIDPAWSGFSSIPDGSHVTVKCKDIWEGMTGHYALPVYCKIN